MKKYILLSLLLGFQIEGTLVIDNKPVTVIEGRLSGICQPEGVAYSPSSSYLAVANLWGNTINFYPKTDSKLPVYQAAPFHVIDRPLSRLVGPHDLSISPDGNYLAIANRFSSSISIHTTVGEFNLFDDIPFSRVEGPKSRLVRPAGVAFSPFHDFIGVANEMGHSVLLFKHIQGILCQSPFQELTAPRNVLKKPNGIAFSPSGEFIAVTSHGTNTILIYRRQVGSKYLYDPDPHWIISGEDALLKYPHSVAFHPSERYLAVTNSAGIPTVCIFERVTKSECHFNPKPVLTLDTHNPETIYRQQFLPQEGGAKGITFSPDGKSLAICVNDIGLPQRAVYVYEVHELDEADSKPPLK